MQDSAKTVKHGPPRQACPRTQQSQTETLRSPVDVQQNFHRAVGNRFMSRFAPVQPQVQTKLKVSEPADEYEREADRVADRVMRMSAPPQPTDGVPGTNKEVQRKCSACEQENEGVLRRKPQGENHASADGGAVAGIPALSGGRPMDAATRGFFESRFNRDFSHVRIHDDNESAAFANGINARAYTLGSHIGFASGEYAPETQSGRRLLAHECFRYELRGPLDVRA